MKIVTPEAMFQLTTFIKSFFVLMVLFSLLFVATKYMHPLQGKAGEVLGIQLSQEQTEPLSQKLQEDVSASLEDAKAKGMETSVEDVIGLASRTKKIIIDYQNLQKEVQEWVDAFFQEQKK